MTRLPRAAFPPKFSPSAMTRPEAATIIGDYYTANPDTDIFLTLGPNAPTRSMCSSRMRD